MFKVSVVRFKNVDTAKERAYIRHLHYKTFKGVCRALSRFSWDFSIHHFKVYLLGDDDTWFYISNSYDFEKDFLFFKSYFEKRSCANDN